MPKSEAGAANVLIIVVIIAALAIGGYFLLSQKGGLPTSVPTLTPRATEKDFDFIQDPTLKKHFVAQANQTSYRSKSTSPGSGLTTVNEFQVKGESFNIRDIESDGTKEKKHMITIDDTIYLKDYSDNKWWKQTIKPEKQKEEKEAPEEPKDFKEEYSKPNLSFKALGKEACGNLTCFKYEQTIPETPDVKRIFWFDDKDYLLRKEQGGFGEFIVTIEYSYDGINIQAPSPTKDVPEGRNIYEYSSGSDTQVPVSPTKDQLPQIPQDLNTGEPSNGDTGN